MNHHIFHSRINITRLNYWNGPIRHQITISSLRSKSYVRVMTIVHILDSFYKNVIITSIQKSEPHLFYSIKVRKYH